MDPPATTLPPVRVPHVDNPTAAATTTSATVVAAGATILPSHPPYAQMITDAITALKDRNGSSKKAIAKYIDRVYSNLPGTHSALLTHHLKRLKESGQLVMVKHSYKLAGSAPQVQANGPKRGPGRPSKAKSAVNVQAQQVPLLQPQPQPPVNATAGPGPISVPESVFASLGLVDGPVAVTKRRPGRPKKTDAAGVGLQPNLSAVKKRPGRPPKDGSAAPGSAVGRPRGRPPRNAGSPGRPRGRPSKNVVAPATVGGAAGPVLVPTGYVAETATVTGPVPPAFPILKRRGRPPKAADGPKKPRKLSGKPLGRPKKGRNSKALLDLETDSKTSIESKLLFCKEDDFFKSQTTKKKTSLPDTKPDISAVPQSQVLGKVKDFLGVLSEANKRLQYDAKDNSHKYDIEALTGAESEYIEMDLMLGVADLHTPEAVAAAESAISGSQPVISLAVSSSSDDDNDDESDDDDEKTTWATGDNSSSEEKRKNHSKKRPKIIELP